MNKKNLAIILISIIVLTGCGSSPKDTLDDIEFHKGTKGLVVEFTKNTLDEVVEEGRIYATLELKNIGASDIKEGILVPSVEQDYVEIDSWKIPDNFRTARDNVLLFNLKGKSLSLQKGEKQIVSAIINTKKIEDTRNKIESTLVFNMCYPYSTILSETICIDTDPEGLSVAKKTCESKDITTMGGQGAPISITKVEQKVIPSISSDAVRIQFTIYAENKEDGIIIDDNRYQQVCLGEGITKDDYDVIRLKSIRFSDYEYDISGYEDIECSPNPLKETKNKYYTICTLKEENSIPKSKFTFETPLIVELLYGYKITESKKIEILNNDILT